MKTIFSFFATIFFSANAFTQSSAEITCRAQAKEIAVQTYSSCITEARNNKVEEIRKSYQQELADLKAKYDRELKKMGAGKKQAAAAAPKPLKGVAKELPTRPPVSGDAALVQNVSEGAKVVAVGSEEPTPQTDEPELVEMPIE